MTISRKELSLKLQPVHGLWKMYQPEKARYAFRAKTKAEAKKWQSETRNALNAALGFQDTRRVLPEPKTIERVDKGDYVREKVLIRTSANAVMPVYLLIPKAVRRPLPSVVAFHGHGYGVKDIVGLWEDGCERDTPDGYHKDFAVELCRKGMAVAAPEISCFGERQTDFERLRPSSPTSCAHTAMLAFHFGASALGLRVWDAKRLIDYLGARKEFDTTRLGAMGFSGGGMHTLFSMCLDTRIKAGVISGYYSTFRDTVLATGHCPCNFVPGLSSFGEMCDLIGLVAQRPVLIEAGDHDDLFPLKAVKEGVTKGRKVYDVFGAGGNIETDYFGGRHQISGAKAYDFSCRQTVTMSFAVAAAPGRPLLCDLHMR